MLLKAVLVEQLKSRKILKFLIKSGDMLNMECETSESLERACDMPRRMWVVSYEGAGHSVLLVFLV